MTNNASQRDKIIKTLLYVVAGFGVALTIVTELSHHYTWIMELCGGDSSGCADVQSTPYSRIFGVSVAYWGLLSYVAFLFMLVYFPALTLPMASALLGAEFYFMWVMSSVIHVYCMFCLIQFFTVVVLFALTVAWHMKRREFFLPGGLWSAPMVTLLVFLAMVIPVKLLAPAPADMSGELITYEGNPDSAVRIEIFSDYQCPYCKKMESEIEKIRKNNPDVLIVYRDYIIGSHKLSPVAVSYATAVALTKGREEYLKVRSEIFENQEKLYEYLEKHLDEIEFTDKLKREIKAKVDEDMKIAASYEIYQTPSMVIYHGSDVAQIIKGPKPYEKFARFLKP